MAYLADPGGVFASDTHRRVLAHLPKEPMEFNAFGHRLSRDPWHGIQDAKELERVLGELEREGYAKGKDGHWSMASAGLEALQAPAPERPGPITPAVIEGLSQIDTNGALRGQLQ